MPDKISPENIKIMSVLGLCVTIFLTMTMMLFNTISSNNKDVTLALRTVDDKVDGVKVDIAILSNSLDNLVKSTELKNNDQDRRHNELKDRVKEIERQQK